MLKHTCLVIGFLWVYSSAQATRHSYYFKHYQVEQGLSNNAVLCSLLDTTGFLWFGTKDGLNRFDGYSFKTYRQEPDNPESQNSNFVRVLHEDDDGLFWIGTDQGIMLFDPKTERFSHFHPDIYQETIAIESDTSGNIWFISNLNLYRYNRAAKELTHFHPDEYFLASALHRGKDNRLWIGTTSGNLYVHHPAGPLFTSVRNVFSQSSRAVSGWIERIYDTGSGTLLIGTTKQGVKELDIATGQYRDLIGTDHHGGELFVRDIIQRGPNEYWFATESGIYIYQNGLFSQLKKQYYLPWSLSDNAVYTFCTDREGGLWIGTYFGGINYYHPQNAFFERFIPLPGFNAISGNAVREITEDQYGDIWIGTEDAGLNKLETQTNRFIHFQSGKKGTDIATTNIHGLLASGDTLWVGTFQRGLDLLHIKTGKIIRHYDAGSGDNALDNNFIFKIYKTRAGTILLATGRGIYRYHPGSGDFSLFNQFPDYIFYTTLFEDSRDVLWAGTWRDGLYFFNTKTGEQGFYSRNHQDESSLSNNRITDIFEDSKRRIWIATEGGLCLFQEQDKQFKRYTAQNGLPGDLILRLLEDASGLLWISTSKGLACFHPEKELIRIFNKESGLLTDQFNYNSAYRDRAGNMYFGSVNGMIRFNPSALPAPDHDPPVYITGFQVHNQELSTHTPGSSLSRSITFTDTVLLHHNQSTFSIDFAALSFTSPGMMAYAYKMEGLDKNWTYIRTNRKAFFTELPPGSYVFRVTIINSEGKPSGKETSLHIRISPPWWKSAFAYLCYVLAAGTITFFIIRSYHLRVKERNRRRLEIIRHRKEEELYHSKIDFFTNVAHEIRTPLTLIKAPLEKVMKKADELPGVKKHLLTMERNTERLIELTGQLLDFRKTEAKGFSLHIAQTDVTALIRDNYLRFKSVAEEKKIRTRLAMPRGHVAAWVDAEAFTKIISNLLNNAVKYAKSKVVIELDYAQSDTFSVIVRNDGFLIPEDMRNKIFETFYRLKETGKQSGTGLGLALARSLAELHNGKLVLAEAENDMNVFILTMPVKTR